jgi:hypothetical protein
MKWLRGAFHFYTAGRSWYHMASIFVLALTATGHVGAQRPTWSGRDALSAWAGYNSDFYTPGANGGAIFTDLSIKAGGAHWSSFWEEAEEIEVAEDAYDFLVKHYPRHDRSAYVKEIDALCNGFVENMPAKWKGPGDRYDWSANRFNDDFAWVAIAFARAYQITGNANWLAAAEECFNAIWNRAQPNGRTDGSNGLQQTQPRGETWTQNLDSPVNFTFVIAGYRLHDSTTGQVSETYKSRADAIYAWAKANLYVYNFKPCNDHPGLVCSKIYDSNNSSVGGKIGSFDYTYNYGIAIQAATLENDVTMASTAANWLMYNSNNPNYPYVGTYDGYNILPNYSAHGALNSSNNSGYNGIALRGIGFGISHSSLTGADVLPWAQANLQSAWNHRSADNVTWDSWVSPTSGDAYSWGDSGSLAGMLDIPAPGGYPKIK